MTSLEPLLTVQERDLALDRLRHRRATLEARGALDAARAAAAALGGRATAIRSERDAVAREESAFEDEAQGLADQATAAERRLYSGEVSSPRELQALQADVEQLRRHQRTIEERAIQAMERREPLDTALEETAAALQAREVEIASLEAALATAEAEIDAEIAREADARGGVAAVIDPALLGDYERCRAKAQGVGAARLVGHTCQGCHLTIPAGEVDRIRKAPPGTIAHCDNCGCILVP